MRLRDEFSFACIASQCRQCSHPSLGIYLQGAFPHFSLERCCLHLRGLVSDAVFPTDTQVLHYSDVRYVPDVGRFVATMFTQGSAWWVGCWTCRFKMDDVIKLSALTDMRYKRDISGSDSIHGFCWFPTPMAEFESECSPETVSASWSDVLSISTVCDAPFSLGHHSTHCRFRRRGIFHNYTLGHLLYLGHHSRWVPVRRTRWMETQLTQYLHLSLKLSTPQAASQPVSPASQEDVVGPDHWEGQQLVQATAGHPGFHRGETLHVPQDELSPGQPLLVGLTVALEGLHPPGHLRVLGQVLWNVDVISAPPLRHPCKNKTLPVEWKMPLKPPTDGEMRHKSACTQFTNLAMIDNTRPSSSHLVRAFNLCWVATLPQ